MHVPEATVHENHGIEAWEHQIRRSRQLSIMQTVSQAQSVHRLAQRHFWAGIMLSHGRHDTRAHRLAHRVHHNHTLSTMPVVTNASR
jgi:hypothetical protein